MEVRSDRNVDEPILRLAESAALGLRDAYYGKGPPIELDGLPNCVAPAEELVFNIRPN
jgi:hypothetical protein